jgi:hypothetical protein
VSDPNDPAAAVIRVLELHARCACKACEDRPIRYCTACHEYWPCSTAHAVRGTDPDEETP